MVQALQDFSRDISVNFKYCSDYFDYFQFIISIKFIKTPPQELNPAAAFLYIIVLI